MDALRGIAEERLYRIYLWGGLASLVISFGTICYQTLKAAWADPADSLRYE